MPKHRKRTDEVLKHIHLKRSQLAFLERKLEEFTERADGSCITLDLLVQGAIDHWMKAEVASLTKEAK